jgi:DNA helicase-2/ATP-dependent DNA helicase PcrA
MILDSLNPEQQVVVTHERGPLLVLAGAGSGKTKALIHRIAYLMSVKQVAGYQIMAVTFTNKAAQEMRTRVEKLLAEQTNVLVNQCWVPFTHFVPVFYELISIILGSRIAL